MSAIGGIVIAAYIDDLSLAERAMEVLMASETELFYLVLLTVLTLIIHFILSVKGRRDHRR
jgi:hypothetical protein